MKRRCHICDAPRENHTSCIELECTDTDTGISIGPIRIRKFVILKKCQYGYVLLFIYFSKKKRIQNANCDVFTCMDSMVPCLL